MLKYLLVLTLLLGACGMEADGIETAGAAGGAPDVAVSTEAVCGSPDYNYQTTNNGHALDESSYKTRALRSFPNLGVCSGSQNRYTCSSDTCIATSTSTSPYGIRAASCFDLPSCAAWSCRECTVQFMRTSSSAWANGTNRVDLFYQQGYGVAKFIYFDSRDTFATSRIIPTTGIHYGD